MTTRLLSLVLTATLLIFSASALAQAPGHIMMKAGEVKWADAPPSFPPGGAKLAVLEGDLSKPGPFTMRIKLPANYKVPPHFHPAIEHVTVLSGTFYLGMGEKFDEKKGAGFPVGGFVVMPEKTPHFAWTKGDVTIQVHGVGPWGLTYVNPDDDPRKKK
ncbi:MAG: cupin domain-containing protein [Dehalococcoidia bacterium]|nr:cupin domain-containing protein [Dehalococcoidia bacterium]